MDFFLGGIHNMAHFNYIHTDLQIYNIHRSWKWFFVTNDEWM